VWALFGKRKKVIDGEVVLCEPAAIGDITDFGISNAAQLKDKIAVVKRGGGLFTEAVKLAMRAGAFGLVIVISDDTLYAAGTHVRTESDGTLRSLVDPSDQIPWMTRMDGFDEILVVMIKAKDIEALLASGKSSSFWDCRKCMACEVAAAADIHSPPFPSPHFLLCCAHGPVKESLTLQDLKRNCLNRNLLQFFVSTCKFYQPNKS